MSNSGGHRHDAATVDCGEGAAVISGEEGHAMGMPYTEAEACVQQRSKGRERRVGGRGRKRRGNGFGFRLAAAVVAAALACTGMFTAGGFARTPLLCAPVPAFRVIGVRAPNPLGLKRASNPNNIFRPVHQPEHRFTNNG